MSPSFWLIAVSQNWKLFKILLCMNSLVKEVSTVRLMYTYARELQALTYSSPEIKWINMSAYIKFVTTVTLSYVFTQLMHRHNSKCLYTYVPTDECSSRNRHFMTNINLLGYIYVILCMYHECVSSFKLNAYCVHRNEQ